MKTRAMNLLLRRKEAYLANVRLANEDGNIKYAKECADTVIMFDQALEACEEQEVTMEDLCNIPGTPPPYKVSKHPSICDFKCCRRWKERCHASFLEETSCRNTKSSNARARTCQSNYEI